MKGTKTAIFEWSDRSLFLAPPNQSRKFGNMRGAQPVRLLHDDYLPRQTPTPS